MAPRNKNGQFLKPSEFIRRKKASALRTTYNKNRKFKNIQKSKVEMKNIGRRIVDISLLGQKMWCPECKIPLSFSNLKKETMRGLASVFHIQCSQCPKIIKVSSSGTVHQNGSSLYAVNCKAAAGCLDSGVGHEQFKTMLSAMNLPILHHNTIKRSEARTGRAFEALANESCIKVIERERSLTLEVKSDSADNEKIQAVHTNDETEVGIVGEFDFGWDKRGSGFVYNSKSGRGSVIGRETKKVIAWEVMTTACSMCARGHPPDDHDCRKNHEGSAKSMEPASAVNLLARNDNFQKGNVRIDVLVGDEDASTICHVQQATNHTVEKWIDTNHTVKKFSNKLYTASKTHKFLSSSVIAYLKRCFTYCISQNIGNANGLKVGLQNIAKHTFGEHDSCGEWCKARNDSNYCFKRLPNGKPFSQQAWRNDFIMILESYVQKAEKIAPGGSSQRNESFNHMVVTRAPKSRFYGSSPALSYRVAAAVLQKNEGAEHIVEVNEKAGLSPGKLTEKYRAMLEQKRKKKFQRQETVEFKRRRLFNNIKNNNINCKTQRKEGLTYMSGMGSTMERAIAATHATDDFIPQLVPLQDTCKIVIVDTETTGFGANAEIVHIAAVCGSLQFQAYMLPQQGIHPKASEANRLTVRNGSLLYLQNEVETVPSDVAAKEFLNFLCNLQSQILIIGHNVVKFDAPLIFRWLAKYDLTKEIYSILYGLTDTIPLLRQGKIAKQDLLARQYLTGSEWDSLHKTAHNALTDCLLLNGLLEHFKISNDILKANSVSMHDFLKQQAMKKKQQANVSSLLPLKETVSRTILNKMARNGITVVELKTEFQLHGKKGIEACLGVKVNNKPRVTMNKKIIENVVQCIKNVIEKENVLATNSKD